MTDTNTTESDTDATDTANSQLTERVRQLEAQVQSQQSTIERLMPSRRDILKAGAGGVVGAVALSGSSSASTGSAGSIGSQSDRPDIFADAITAGSVNTGSATVGGSEVFERVNRFDLAGESEITIPANGHDQRRLILSPVETADGVDTLRLSMPKNSPATEFVDVTWTVTQSTTFIELGEVHEFASSSFCGVITLTQGPLSSISVEGPVSVGRGNMGNSLLAGNIKATADLQTEDLVLDFSGATTFGNRTEIIVEGRQLQ